MIHVHANKVNQYIDTCIHITYVAITSKVTSVHWLWFHMYVSELKPKIQNYQALAKRMKPSESAKHNHAKYREDLTGFKDKLTSYKDTALPDLVKVMDAAAGEEDVSD